MLQDYANNVQPQMTSRICLLDGAFKALELRVSLH